MTKRSLVPETTPVHRADRHTADQLPPGATVATDDPELIQEWARRHGAEPATGEATESGPATVNVQDGGAGIRFNFPATSRFRPIPWDEWFSNFSRHALLFVFERETPGAAPNPSYRLVPKGRLGDQAE